MTLVEVLVSKGLKGMSEVLTISGRESGMSNMASSGSRVYPAVKARDLSIFAGEE